MANERATRRAESVAAPLALAATYRREVAASLARVWENVHDWEHLPWLHATSFAAAEPLARGPRGWRVRLIAQPGDPASAQVIELDADEPGHRYRVVTREGPGRGSEIRVQLEPRAAHVTGVEVEFHVPAVPPAKLARLGASYVELYRRLWDEDEEMMIARERACALVSTEAVPHEDRRLDLGPVAAVRARVPFLVELGGRPFRVLELDGDLVAHAATCPHRLGPLGQAPVRDGCVTCPWHGYRFDVRTGASADGRRLRLATAPQVSLEGGRVVLHRAP
ncbi:MAG: Rieske 2Fe-2S domain-containing protein [Deltaproteobacteria bacterium]|nr:Rieske 2Fe-2S domain-containing protein [Deltaproteobacteria bacterium]